MNAVEYTEAKKPLSMICRVKAEIHAKPEVIWQLLTDAGGFPRWNSTITGIDGEIKEGERIRIHVPGTRRTFTPRVTDVENNRRMTWSDGIAGIFRGKRNFCVNAGPGGITIFTMEERFDGWIFGLVKNKMPNFQPIFETYAKDLKNESESLFVH